MKAGIKFHHFNELARSSAELVCHLSVKFHKSTSFTFFVGVLSDRPFYASEMFYFRFRMCQNIHTDVTHRTYEVAEYKANVPY